MLMRCRQCSCLCAPYALHTTGIPCHEQRGMRPNIILVVSNIKRAGRNYPRTVPSESRPCYSVVTYDILQVEIESTVDNILQECQDITLVAAKVPQSLPPFPPSFSPAKNDLPLAQAFCAPILVQRCSVCFGGQDFGRSLDSGGDVHVAMGGNFHHQHRRSAGDCPLFYDPIYFLPKLQVNEVGK